MRILDADELRKQMYHEAFETDTDMQKWDSGCWIRYKMFENVIENAPTIEAEPVRHGQWKQNKYYPHIIICNECGEPYELSNSMEHWNYCPNCGCKMDLDEVEE